MWNCRIDGNEFEDEDSAKDHIREKHSGLIDEELQDFVSDAEERIFEAQLEGEDE
jgi:hypothetical protein